MDVLEFVSLGVENADAAGLDLLPRIDRLGGSVVGLGTNQIGDGVRIAVTSGQAAYWAPSEVHTAGSDTGLTASALEGGPVTVFEPEAH